MQKHPLNLTDAFRKTIPFVYLLLAALAFSGLQSCGSQKKAAAAAEAKRKAEMEAAKQRKIDKAVANLRALINDSSKNADQLQAALNEIKGRGVSGDPEVSRLIKLVESKIADLRKQEEEAKRKADEELARKKAAEEAARGPQGLDEYFSAITNASSSAEANKLIGQALAKFSKPEADVLIIITMAGGQPDYDEPTTIVKYLNYLKDQKKNLNKVYNVEKDSAGRIKLLELIRK